MACTCAYCRTGKCGCEECTEGPGIDFNGRSELLAEILRDIAIRRAERGSSPESLKVRRWGETGTSPKAVQAARAAENDNQE